MFKGYKGVTLIDGEVLRDLNLGEGVFLYQFLYDKIN